MIGYFQSTLNLPLIERHSNQRWEDALQHCKNELGPDDYALVMSFRSPEEMSAAIDSMQKEARETSISRLLRQFKPRIQHLKTFTFGIATGVGLESLQTACMWGVVTLMLEVLHLRKLRMENAG